MAKPLQVVACLCGCMVMLTACALFNNQDTAQQRRIETKGAVTVNQKKIVYLHEYKTASQTARQAFDAFLKEHANVVVDFYADWCGPCRSLGSVIQRTSSDQTDVVFLKVDIDKFSNLATDFGIRSIPVLLFYKDGNQVDKKVGGLSAAQLNVLIQRNV